VLHFAALCLVDESMKHPEKYFANNVIGTLNLLEAMREAEVKKLIFSSTCAVYGNSEYLPLDEKHPTNPTNPYGESKLISEKMIEWYARVYGMKYAILRYFNVCGAAGDGSIGDSKKPSVLLLQNAVRGAMGIKSFVFTCPKVDTPDGTPIRDYIDVEDLAKAHYLAYIKLDGKAKNQIFNLSNGRGWSVKEIVKQVEETFKLAIDKKTGETRQGEYAAVYAEPKKAKELLEWQAEKTLADSIASMQKWYTAHPDGWAE
jgi:UDP-glucose 4-epimerase